MDGGGEEFRDWFGGGLTASATKASNHKSAMEEKREVRRAGRGPTKVGEKSELTSFEV